MRLRRLASSRRDPAPEPRAEADEVARPDDPWETVWDVLENGPIPITCDTCGAANSFKGKKETKPYLLCKCAALIMLTDEVKYRAITRTMESFSKSFER